MSDLKSVERDRRIIEFRQELQDLEAEKTREETAPQLRTFRSMQKALPWMK